MQSMVLLRRAPSSLLQYVQKHLSAAESIHGRLDCCRTSSSPLQRREKYGRTIASCILLHQISTYRSIYGDECIHVHICDDSRCIFLLGAFAEQHVFAIQHVWRLGVSIRVLTVLDGVRPAYSRQSVNKHWMVQSR